MKTWVITLQSLSCLALSKAQLGTGTCRHLGIDMSRSQAVTEKMRGSKSQPLGGQKLFLFLHQGHSSHCARDEVTLPLYLYCQNDLLTSVGWRVIKKDGIQGWLSLMWFWIIKSSSFFLVMILPVSFLPVSPFT